MSFLGEKIEAEEKKQDVRDARKVSCCGERSEISPKAKTPLKPGGRTSGGEC